MEQIRMDSAWVSVKICDKFLVMRRSTGCYPCFQGISLWNVSGSKPMKVIQQRDSIILYRTSCFLAYCFMIHCCTNVEINSSPPYTDCIEISVWQPFGPSRNCVLADVSAVTESHSVGVFVAPCKCLFSLQSRRWLLLPNLPCEPRSWTAVHSCRTESGIEKVISCCFFLLHFPITCYPHLSLGYMFLWKVLRI